MKPEITPGFRFWPKVGPEPNILYALSTALYSPTYSLLPGLLLTRGREELYFAIRNVGGCTNTKVKGNQKAATWQLYSPKSLHLKGVPPLPPACKRVTHATSQCQSMLQRLRSSIPATSGSQSTTTAGVQDSPKQLQASSASPGLGAWQNHRP